MENTLQGGTWSLPEKKLHINYLELKVVFLALKEFQDLCLNKIVLVATGNTLVININKERSIKSGSLCALLWRILTWCSRKQVTLKAQHIPGWLNVVAENSRLNQTILNMQQVASTSERSICYKVQQQTDPVCVTSSRLPDQPSLCHQFQTPWPGQSMHSALHGRIWTHVPPVAILAKVVAKLQDYPCR